MQTFLSLLPSLLLFVTTVIFFVIFFFTIRKFITRDLESKLLEMKMNSNKDTLQLRLQAYERLIMLLERISPQSVIARVNQPDLLSAELQYAIVTAIRAEYEHNCSQQMYVSNTAWQLITSSKDEIIKLVGLIGANVPPDASGHQLSRKIFEAIAATNAPLPTQTALEFLKAEARELF